jgi:putative transposase
MAYSLDFRKLAVCLVREDGLTPAAVAKQLKVGLNSVRRWLKRDKLAPDKPGPTQSRVIDPEQLKAVLAVHPDAYLDELAKRLCTSSSTISYTLKKLKISRKKNHAVRGTKRRSAQQIPTGPEMH